MKEMKSNFEFTFTVFTPTFNRAYVLERLYNSLKKQTFRDFEWIIIDDGSEDGTKELVDKWKKEAWFPINYIWQPNSGKHVAINRGVEVARGFLFLIVDSDDWLGPNGLERLLYLWETIPEEDANNFAGVGGLLAFPNGEIIGDVFPTQVWDSNMLDRWLKWGIKGDKMECFRTDVLRLYKFPEDIGKFVPEGIVWNKIGNKYKMRYFNEIIAYREYLPDGLSSKGLSFAMKTALARWLYFKDLCALVSKRRDVSFYKKIRFCVSYTRFALHARVSIVKQFLESSLKIWWIISFPVGLGVFIWDHIRVKIMNQN
ncbi:MAG TPA: hypothetical protein DEA61_12085 [Caldanaerobacter subterraneus]|uniref:Glycosyltransferase 2-like domain-containing protein n=2 Tax=Thermoanaerobacterales TaxID=68295 RepID=A0A357VQ30_9THEO|nr:hypothetical protein [Caldanaerobacter sp.]HBT50483.1 hypothetical protein [Caldanaerobacter subterraneus]